MNLSYNVRLLTEAFERLRRAKSMEIEAIKMAHRAEINDLLERNGNSTICEPKDNEHDWSLGAIGKWLNEDYNNRTKSANGNNNG